MKTYHLALIKGNQGYWHNGHRQDTIILQARRDLDCLSCEAWRYLGERIVTKAHLHHIKAELLQAINQDNGTSYKHIIID